MKIAINGRPLLHPFTGIGQYTKNILQELSKNCSDAEFVVVVPDKVDKKTRSGFGKNIKFKVIAEKKLQGAGMRKTWWEQIQLPQFIKTSGIKTIFYPYPSNPWVRSFYKDVRVILTIHDCIPWLDKRYRRGALSRMYHWQTRRAVKFAAKILTVSKHSKKEILKVCGVAAGKIDVAHNDANEVYKSGRVIKEVLQRFGLKNGQYLLYVGGYDARKNVRYLVAEYKKFAEKVGAKMPLVLCGGKVLSGKLYESFDDKFEGNIIRTGFLEEQDLASLYGGCFCFVNFSEEEGFNIPVLEAANMGAAIILSNIEAHKELFGKNVMLVDIKKPGAGVAALQKMLAVRKTYRAKSKQLSKSFSWSKTAEKVKNVLFS